jgi:antitoxin MazE
MRADLVRIGNSRGIRIPKLVIEQCGFEKSVELSVENHRLVISPDRTPRQGWDEAFQAAGPSTDDPLLLEGLPPDQFEREEWTW